MYSQSYALGDAAPSNDVKLCRHLFTWCAGSSDSTAGTPGLGQKAKENCSGHALSLSTENEASRIDMGTGMVDLKDVGLSLACVGTWYVKGEPSYRWPNG